ncbi:MAG: hypothetical protein IIY60_00970, partial [Clostridia bacterium]|nr:hypothetical protein [Clostridia bacterium]
RSAPARLRAVPARIRAPALTRLRLRGAALPRETVLTHLRGLRAPMPVQVPGLGLPAPATVCLPGILRMTR